MKLLASGTRAVDVKPGDIIEQGYSPSRWFTVDSVELRPEDHHGPYRVIIRSSMSTRGGIRTSTLHYPHDSINVVIPTICW